MNLDELNTDLTAAIQQLMVAEEHMPHSKYRVQLINKLGKWSKLITYRQRLKQVIESNPVPIPKPRPYLPWDD